MAAVGCEKGVHALLQVRMHGRGTELLANARMHRSGQQARLEVVQDCGFERSYTQRHVNQCWQSSGADGEAVGVVLVRLIPSSGAIPFDCDLGPERSDNLLALLSLELTIANRHDIIESQAVWCDAPLGPSAGLPGP